ncbi:MULTISPECIES: hypothetical protein [unclassified Streptomyces]|uniref:hypothetical protein n=1 Tax=unclassified Streptomyces TaxID=2593676 RepID=UPI00226E750A|nr:MULTISPECIES: hypothetical protein [unclassified Streptomyces]MCY0923912.1 hypothetical protein [Streptomyces sp. H27-G5]MCY0962031.1 hypothetical protein [Streptomyces sp. H27-H5]
MTQPQIRETWARAIEPEPSVTITEETFFGHGWQPLTLSVLQALWFMPPGEEFDVPELVGWFRALGWKSANGKPLGEDAVRRELALIRKAGYIRTFRVRLEGGQLGGARYEISKRPKPPQEQIEYILGDTTNAQVTPNASIEGVRSAPDASIGQKRRSDLMPPMTRSGGSPAQVDEAKAQVTPDASNGGFPPTPPLVVVTTTPNPLTDPSEPARLADPAARGEAAAASEYDTEALAAAAEFLQELPAPFAVGRPTAKRYAPLLVESTRAQGWELDDALAAELVKGQRPNNPQAALKPRIENLVRRHRAARTVPNQSRASEQPALDLPEYCGDLDCDELTRMRTVEDEQGWRTTALCDECHPARVRRPAAAGA